MGSELSWLLSLTTISSLLLFPGFWGTHVLVYNLIMKVLSRYLEGGKERQRTILWRKLQADVNKCSAYQNFTVSFSEPLASFQTLTLIGKRKVGRPLTLSFAETK